MNSNGPGYGAMFAFVNTLMTFDHPE